jgi:hypothetical protein
MPPDTPSTPAAPRGPLSKADRDALLAALETRFHAHPHRHPEVNWTEVRERLERMPEKLGTLLAMEETGGEPDVVGRDEDSGAFLFVDCSKQSPEGRRSLCFDPDALASRKKHKPRDSAMNMAAALGVELLTEAEYRALQALEPFDTTTSSWIRTPDRIRALGGALLCDRRYDTVFLYHNGAESYYAARGFRGMLRV